MQWGSKHWLLEIFVKVSVFSVTHAYRLTWAKGSQLGTFCPYKQAIVYCYLDFKLHYLKNLKLFSIRVTESFESIVLQKTNKQKTNKHRNKTKKQKQKQKQTNKQTKKTLFKNIFLRNRSLNNARWKKRWKFFKNPAKLRREICI